MTRLPATARTSPEGGRVPARRSEPEAPGRASPLASLTKGSGEGRLRVQTAIRHGGVDVAAPGRGAGSGGRRPVP